MNARYAPGGDIYVAIAAQYGTQAADRVRLAHESGRQGAVAQVLSELRFGQPLNTSTASLLADQLITDPFAAPLDFANRGIGNVFTSALKGVFGNFWVLLTVAGVAAFLIYRNRK